MKKLTALGFIMLGSIVTFASIFAFNTATITFSDTDPNAYYAEGLTNMVNDGVITGYEDGTFRPNNNLSRAEFVTALDRYDIDVNNMKSIICNGGISRESLSETYQVTYDTLCSDQ